MLMIMRRRATYATSSARRSSKNPLPPAVSVTASSLEPSFTDASLPFAHATFVAAVAVTSSKNEEQKPYSQPVGSGSQKAAISTSLLLQGCSIKE